MTASQNDNYLIIRIRQLLNAGFDIPKTANQLGITIKHVHRLIIKNIPTDKIYFQRKEPYWTSEDEMEIPIYTMEGLSQHELEFYHSSF